MKNILSGLIVLIFCISLASAQQIAVAVPFSESAPYEPRPAESIELKKKKKTPKQSNDEKKLRSETAASPNAVRPELSLKIPVFVFDRQNKPVTDLSSADFKVFVDDREAEIVALEPARAPRDVLLIVDTSPSLAYQEKDLRNVVTRLIEAFSPEEKIQIISFNRDVKVLSEMSNDASLLQKAVKKLAIGDGTSIYEAVHEIFEKRLAAQDVPPIVVLLTDGVDTTSRKANYASSLEAAERGGAAVFPFYFDSFEYAKKFQIPIPPNSLLNLGLPKVVGLTEKEYEIGRFYVQDIAALSGGRTFVVKNFAEVKKEDFEAALKFTAPQYYVSFKLPDATAGFQRRKIKVRIDRPYLHVASRGSLATGAKKK